MLQLDQNIESPLSEKSSPPLAKPRYGKSAKKTTGRWTKEEHQRFVEGLKKFGKNWKQVEDFVGTRNGTQIRSHAQKFFLRLEREAGTNFDDESNLHSDKEKLEETLRKMSEGSINTACSSQDSTILESKRSGKLQKELSPIPEILNKNDILLQNSFLSNTLSLSNSPKINPFEYQNFPKKSFRKMSEDVLSNRSSYSMFDVILSKIITSNNVMTPPRLSDLVEISSMAQPSFNNTIKIPTPIKPSIGNEPFLNSSFRVNARKMSEDNVLIHNKLNQLRKPDDINFSNLELMTKKFKVN
jgi:SHAQKYF class myb-like DNA-binding protein